MNSKYRIAVFSAIVLGCLSPAASATKSAAEAVDIALLSGNADDVAIVMGGTGMPTMPEDLLKTVIDVLNHHYGSDFVVGTDNVDNLTTPETMSTGTYLAGEQILLTELQKYASDGDGATVFGVSQSAGIEGMALADIAKDPSSYPADLRMVALAPPSMPLHGGGTGLFQNPADQWLMNMLYPNIRDPFPTDNGDYTVDVYCGMYDPICDEPVNFNLVSWLNSYLALGYIHVGYAKLTSAELSYEIDHAHELSTISTDSTHFYLMPDIYNFGTAADPDYQTYLPILSWATFSKPLYDMLEPMVAAQVNAGYGDADHPLPDAMSAQADIFGGSWLSDFWQGVSAALADLGL